MWESLTAPVLFRLLVLLMTEKYISWQRGKGYWNYQPCHSQVSGWLDQFQIPPAASPEILQHTVWRTWLFIVWIILPISHYITYTSLCNRLGELMYFLNLGVKGWTNDPLIFLFHMKRRSRDYENDGHLNYQLSNVGFLSRFLVSSVNSVFLSRNHRKQFSKHWIRLSSKRIFIT